MQQSSWQNPEGAIQPKVWLCQTARGAVSAKVLKETLFRRNMLALMPRTLSDSKFRLTLLEQILVGISLSAVAMWMFPHVTMAQSVQANTGITTSEIKENQNSEDAAITEQINAREIEGSKVYILKNYLESKNSPLADYVEILILQPNWKHVLSISHAESNMCKRQLGNNCWGIGGAKYHRYYPTFAEGIIDANALIQKYHDSGLTTPATMKRRWVGWNNESWVRANENVLAQLESLGL